MVGSALTKKTGYFDSEDPMTGDRVSVSFNEDDSLQGVQVTLREAKRRLGFTPDGEVKMLFRKGSKSIYNLGHGVNSELSPKVQRQTVGYIALSREVFESLVEEPKQLQ